MKSLQRTAAEFWLCATSWCLFRAPSTEMRMLPPRLTRAVENDPRDVFLTASGHHDIDLVCVERAWSAQPEPLPNLYAKQLLAAQEMMA